MPIVAVVAPELAAELDVHTTSEAIQAMRSIAVSVILVTTNCLTAQGWEVVRETERLCPHPKTIVLSTNISPRLWAEVLNCGGYDLLVRPRTQDL